MISPKNILKRLPLIVAALIVVLMPTQWGRNIAVPGTGKAGVFLTAVDFAVWIGLLLWLVSVIVNKGWREIKLPPLAMFVFVGVAVASVCFSSPAGGEQASGLMGFVKSRLGGFKEVFQLTEYFLVAYLLFINAVHTEEEQRLLLNLFLAVSSVVIAFGVYQYVIEQPAFSVASAFGNRNVFGAYLALAAPMMYAVMLHTPSRLLRLCMLVMTALALAVNLSGGALLAALVAILVIGAARGQKVLIPTLVVLALGVALLPRYVLHKHHAKVLVSSVSPMVKDNHLFEPRVLDEVVRLASEEKYPRAYRLLCLYLEREPQKAVIGRAGLLCEKAEYLKAEHLLALYHYYLPSEEHVQRVKDLRKQAAQELEVREQSQPQLVGGDLDDAIAEKLNAAEEPGYVMALRYKRWAAALALMQNEATPLWGVGPGNFQTEVNKSYVGGDKPPGNTDEVEIFNIRADEPDSFNQYLVVGCEMGLLGLGALLWLLTLFIGRALYEHEEATTHLGWSVSLGAFGALLAGLIGSLFTGMIVRGLAIPMVFMMSSVTLLGKRRGAAKKK